MLNSTNVGDGDYFPTFWQEDIHCRFSHATIAAMCSPLYLIWLGFTMSVVVLSQKHKSGKTKCARFEKRNVQKSGKTKRSKNFAHTTL